ncbi:hypothetical protein [Nonomuraea endophytica]|uniref:hypothetical protein n=1 Tax=Nonomuraea endophytica TaxID=714136 RepID=UPI0037C7EF1B
MESGAERARYSAMFVDELASTAVVPEILQGDRLELDCHEVIAVATGQSDHVDSSYIHLPELAAVMVGDIAYNDVHCALMETDHRKRRQWIDTLRKFRPSTQRSSWPRIGVRMHPTTPKSCPTRSPTSKKLIVYWPETPVPPISSSRC